MTNSNKMAYISWKPSVLKINNQIYKTVFNIGNNLSNIISNQHANQNNPTKNNNPPKKINIASKLNINKTS